MARPGQDGIGEPTTLAEIQHDDVLGDAVMEEEAAGALQAAVTLVLGEQAPTNRAVFPGSQPVSLARSNLSLLSHRRYVMLRCSSPSACNTCGVWATTQTCLP